MWVKTQWNWWFGEIYKKSDQSQIGLPLPFLLFCTQMKNHFYQLFSNHSFLRLVKKWKENAVEFGKFFETKVSEGMPAWLQGNCIALYCSCIVSYDCIAVVRIASGSGGPSLASSLHFARFAQVCWVCPISVIARSAAGPRCNPTNQRSHNTQNVKKRDRIQYYTK